MSMQKDRGFDNSVQVAPCSFKHRREILQYLFSLFGYSARNKLTRLRISRYLTRSEHEPIRLYGLGIWSNRLRSPICLDDLLHGCDRPDFSCVNKGGILSKWSDKGKDGENAVELDSCSFVLVSSKLRRSWFC